MISYSGIVLLNLFKYYVTLQWPEMDEDCNLLMNEFDDAIAAAECYDIVYEECICM